MLQSHRVGAAALLLVLAASPAASADGPGGHGDDHGGHHGHHHGHHGHGARDDGPAQIDLPDGWRPEGITTDGKWLYSGSLADGAIFVADPRTGEGEVLAEGAPGRVAVGVDYDKRRDLLWVAGGPTGEVRAQDADTGEVVATFAFPSPDATPRFLNDLVVTRHSVFITDSSHAELAVVDLGSDHRGDRGRAGHHGGSDDVADATTTVLPVTGDFVLEEGFNINGIVSRGHALIAVQSNTGMLFNIDPSTGDSTEVDLDGDDVLNGDGLELGRGRLFVVRNVDNQIDVVHLRRGATEGEVEDSFGNDDIDGSTLDTPTTAALVRHSLFAVNARFSTPPTPTTAYWITRVDVR